MNKIFRVQLNLIIIVKDIVIQQFATNGSQRTKKDYSGVAEEVKTLFIIVQTILHVQARIKVPLILKNFLHLLT